MNKKLRDAMFFFFVLLFFVATFLLSLYAAGYRLDFGRALKGRFLQKTGTMILASTPKGADIYLDGRQAKSSGSIFGNYATTPAKIKNLLPQEYLVEVKLDGYWPWEKKITIYGGQSTYAENIILFKRCVPTEALASLAESCAINLDGAVKDQGVSQAVEAKIGKYQKLKTEDNSNFFFGDKQQISSYNQKTEEISTILDGKTNQEEYLDYLPKDGRLLVIAKKASRIELRSYDLKNNSVINKINLPGAWNYELSSNQNNLAAAYNPDSHSLFIFESKSLSPFGSVVGDANYWTWLDNEQLLIAGDFEITSYDLKNNNRQLITRISEKITGLTWSKKKKYLIYTTDNSINSIDLYEGSGKITKLLDGKKINQPRLDDKTKTLYFKAENNGTKGWQKIEVQ
ncbi:MAG: PEGA domain-containing protein [Candidatus Falkowbacteria bacterium]|nr:PEGA domain-containing protein [Candidatus Falkowbacteria bacterium]